MVFRVSNARVPATLYAAFNAATGIFALAGAGLGVAAWHYLAWPLWPSVIIAQFLWEGTLLAVANARS